jgi:hypothetical protein
MSRAGPRIARVAPDSAVMLKTESPVTDIAVAVAMAAGYFAMCWIGLTLDVTAGVSLVWPASRESCDRVLGDPECGLHPREPG